MKKASLIISGLLFLFIATFQSCVEDDCKQVRTYTYYEPIFVPLDSIRNVAIDASAPREMENTGKLYFYQNYVFINEREKGIHIINNANPAQPINEAFINIPGNVDLAIKGNILYADSYMDMLAINIQNLNAPALQKRVEDVYTDTYLVDSENNRLRTGYRKTEKTTTRKCSESSPSVLYDKDGGAFVQTSQAATSPINQVHVPTGIAGSMARFGLYQNYLYAIDRSRLHVFDITSIDNPVHSNNVRVGWGIETIFPHGENLFIGANDGMYIFDNSEPSHPQQKSKFSHARACDPVYVSGNKAYVTLRDGTECDGHKNQLDIVNIENLDNPFLIKTHEMQHPHGLSIAANNRLFLCEGTQGIKIFDISNDQEIEMLGQVADFDAFDVIALSENHILVIGKDGLYQFDTSNPQSPQLLSAIKVSE